MNDLYLALVHHPVENKRGDIIASALTTIDMHDIARASITFGVRGFFIVTPLLDQQILAREVIGHWTQGVGGVLNPHRKEALSLIRVVSSFEEVVAQVREEIKGQIVTVATSASMGENSVPVAGVRAEMSRGKTVLLALGTAWGLSETFINGCDLLMEPISGVNGYNHLSVRSAASIILDRIRTTNDATR
ncbi:MAG: RNA methyltransferase [Desulfobacterium sp.]|nr:RNA methyltransferase [Desulfobacterium sp.]